MNAALQIAQTLDRHLNASTSIVVFGFGAALLDPRFQVRELGRPTNDIDLIIPENRALEVDADKAFWEAIEATNRDLEPSGLYVTHIFPEQEVILTPEWSKFTREMPHPELNHLKLFRPRVLDLVLSKMGRGDHKDIEDVRAILTLERVTASDLIKASQRAHVPEAYAEIFPRARDSIIQVVREYEQVRNRMNPPRPPDDPPYGPEPGI